MNIVFFHDIRPFDPNFFPLRYKKSSFINRNQFLNIIDQLKKRIAHPSELKNFFLNKYITKDIILTFDDGLKDHLWVADFLFKNGISAIFFVPFCIINSKEFVDSHVIQFLIASGNLNEIEKDIYNFLLKESGLNKKQIENFYISKWKNNQWSKQEVFITRSLREAKNYQLKKEIIKNLTEKYLPIKFADIHCNFYLNFNELLEIEKQGHIIGSHGFYSTDLRFQDSNFIYQDLNNSFNFLKRFKSLNYKMISYPNGGFNEEIINLSRKVGYEIGFTTTNLHVQLKNNLLTLSRFDATKLGYL
jgi:peptidoglycan/xylan/chitin deacetylase (PgdA/CDA1 family)